MKHRNPVYPLAVIGFALALVCLFAGNHARAASRFEFAQPQMGVPFRMVFYAETADQALTASTAAFARVAQLNAILSNYETDSELSQLGYQSGKTGWTPVSDDLFRILTRSQRLSRLSRGAFDLTIGPVAAAWRHARRTGQFPEPNQLARFRNRVGWQHLWTDHSRRQVWLRVPGMRLDPGGIAKGDALDQALAVLAQHEITRALVAGAGDIAVSNPPPQRDSWQIQLTGHPDQEAPKRYLGLKQQAVATSGDLFQFVEIDGKRYSHIVDPRTGIGLTERRLVTVIAPTGIEADSLATTLSVVEREAIPRILKHHPQTHARILTLDHTGPQETHFGQFQSFLIHPKQTAPRLDLENPLD